MSSHSRRSLLAAAAGLSVAACAGCLGGVGGSATTPNSSADCSDPERPNPTSAGAEPRDYPEAPAELTTETVREFVSAFERAYQYNSALADDPGKIGTLNGLEVAVGETTVEAEGSTFTASVSGDLYYSIETPESTETPTPTVTPLPMGRGEFSASYVVSPDAVRREERVVHCW
jgi:hypothetical protein